MQLQPHLSRKFNQSSWESVESIVQLIIVTAEQRTHMADPPICRARVLAH